MVQGVFVNINAAPDALRGLIDWHDADCCTLTREVFLPKLRGPWCADDLGLPSLLALFVAVYGISAVGKLKTTENIAEFI